MKKMKKHTLLIPILGLLQAMSAHADADKDLERLLSLSLEELMAIKVSISTNTPQSLSKAPSVVSVITTDDIKATGATNLADALQGVPGVYVRASQWGFRPLVHVRGANATQTLVMVNGAPMKDLQWSTGIFWKGLPASMIERVEIIRGPGSALFGSDASAGVINVITKTAGKIDRSEAGVRAGSFDSQAGWVQHGGQWNGFDIAFTADLSHTDGHNPLIAADRNGAAGHAGYGWRNEDVRFSLAKGHWRLQADYMRHSNVEMGLAGGGAFDPLTRGSDSRFNIDLLYDNPTFAQDWGLNAELRYVDIDSSSGNGFQETPGQINRQRSAERRLNFEASGLYTGIRNHALRMGAGHIWQDLYSVKHHTNYGPDRNGAGAVGGNLTDSPYAFAPEKVRKIGYLFLQDVWTLSDRWELTAGARYDHYSDFGGTLNPRLALVWKSTDRLTTKLMYGQAFRAPSYQELYSPTATALPNANLDPERSRTWDLAFSYAATKDLRLGLNLFRFAQSDFIARDVPTGQFQNMGKHTTRGIELEAHWQATKTLRLSGNLTHRDQDDTLYRSYLVPNEEAYLRADWAFLPKWNWNLQASWAGKRSRPSNDPRQTLGSHTLVDTTVRYFHRKEWEFAASLRNLFDEDAREYTGRSIPDDLPLPGRSFYAEMRYKF